MKITKEMLIEKQACPLGREWFNRNFGEEGDSDDILNKLQEEKDSKGWQMWLCEKFGLTKTAYNYYTDGKIAKKTNYKNGALDGECIEYLVEATIKDNYKDGKLEGECIEYFENGKIAKKTNYKNGALDGECIIYYINGNLKIKKNYKDGKLEGECIEYYENRNVKLKTMYKDGKECECI